MFVILPQMVAYLVLVLEFKIDMVCQLLSLIHYQFKKVSLLINYRYQLAVHLE